MNLHKLPRPWILRCALAASAGVLTIGVASAGAAPLFTPVPVKVKPNPVREQTPAASPSYFAWSQTSVAHPNQTNVYEQTLAGGPATRVNTLNSYGFAGSIDNTRLVYQQVIKGQSDIRYFNLALHTHSNPPPGVNSTQWEWDPSVSGNWLMFGRQNAASDRVLLMNLTTRSIRVLMNQKSASGWLAAPGQVNGNWATFYACRAAAGCNVYRYDIAANTTTTIPRPAGTTQYYPSVASDGTLYFGRSAIVGCGKQVTVQQLPLGGTATTIHSFSPGIDMDATQVASDGTADQFYYTRYTCSNSGMDIYRSAVG